MSVQHVDPGVPVRVTPAAVRHFRQKLAGTGAAGIRLRVKESGCTGYMYVVDIADSPAETDMPMRLADDVSLLVDRGSISVLQGTTVDYVREGLNFLLKFENPNAQDHCGCGESFNIREASA
jgi:iron-sulfur cluster assembly accessory protein